MKLCVDVFIGLYIFWDCKISARGQHWVLLPTSENLWKLWYDILDKSDPRRRKCDWSAIGNWNGIWFNEKNISFNICKYTWHELQYSYIWWLGFFWWVGTLLSRGCVCGMGELWGFWMFCFVVDKLMSLSIRTLFHYQLLFCFALSQ